ncbi:MAG: four helix bundle protein [bacterium]
MNKKIEKFEDIVAWQNARILTQDIYALFRLNKDFGFKDQIQRAAVSVMSNIAEGYERQSNKEFAQFLYIAKGSCAEIRSLLCIGRDLKYITEEQFIKLNSASLVISKLISGFITYIRKSVVS